MTQTLDPPTRAPAPDDGPAHPVTAFVRSLTAALDRLEGTPTWSMTADEQRAALVALHRQRARLAELELRVLVTADRDDVGAASGATSTAAWLADATASRRADCFAQVHLSHDLDEGFDHTRRALAAGNLDVDQAAIVVRAVTALSEEHDDLPAGTHERAEAHLVELARHHDAVALRRLARRLFEVVCPEAADLAEGRTLAEQEERARRLAYLSVRDNGDGTSEGRFRLPTLHAHVLRKALEVLTSPRRSVPAADGGRDGGRFAGQDAAGVPDVPRAPTGVRRRPAHSTLLGRGLMELVERHLSLDTLPGASGSPFTVVVTVGLEALRSGLGIAALETGERISAGEARRLACAAGIIPMVLGGGSVPLDLGRERRLFTKHQRIALAQIHGGCAVASCDRPPSQTEAHHLRPWRHGGPTDLDNGIPLCSAHHVMADDPHRWEMTVLEGGAVRFGRRRGAVP